MISNLKLKKGFIVNDEGELKHLFLKSAKHHGFCTEWFNGKEEGLFGTYLFIDEEGVVNGNSNLSRVHRLGRKVLKLQDFLEDEESQQTQKGGVEYTSVKYVPVKCGVWEIASLKDDFEAGLLSEQCYSTAESSWVYPVITDHNDLLQCLLNNTVYRKTVTNWYDKLDGTEENGVWCWVWDDDMEHPSNDFVVEYRSNTEGDHTYFVANSNTCWDQAKPMSQHAREEMLKIMK